MSFRKIQLALWHITLILPIWFLCSFSICSQQRTCSSPCSREPYTYLVPGSFFQRNEHVHLAELHVPNSVTVSQHAANVLLCLFQRTKVPCSRGPFFLVNTDLLNCLVTSYGLSYLSRSQQLTGSFPPCSTPCSVLSSKGTPVFLLTQLQTMDSVIVPVHNYKHVPPPVPENHTPTCFPKERLCSSLLGGNLVDSVPCSTS